MQSIVEIKEDVEFVKILKSICQAYQEISVIRMQKIRGSVLNIRRFLSSLSEVFADIKSSYALSLINKKNIDEINLSTKKDKEIAVLISENESLYGDLLQKVFEDYRNYVLKNDCSLMIIGKKGLQLYNEARIPKETIYFDLADKQIETNDIKYIIFSLIQYKKITVFYGKFESVITQKSTSSVISDSEVNSNLETKDNQKREYFAFEPSVEEIVSFFETQVFASLLKQTISESQLARDASRIKAMEETLTRIEAKEKVMKILQTKELHKIADKKQLNNLSAIYKFKG